MIEAKEAEAASDFVTALSAYTQAGAILQTPQITKKLSKLQRLTSINEEEDENGVMMESGFSRKESKGVCTLDGGFQLPCELSDKMFPHQRDGVAWLWGLHKADAGGILGDDMVGGGWWCGGGGGDGDGCCWWW